MIPAPHSVQCDEAEEEGEGGQWGEHPRGVGQEEEEDEVEDRVTEGIL